MSVLLSRRIRKLEERINPTDDLKTLSDAELVQGLFHALEVMLEEGMSLDEDEDMIRLAELFFVDRERLKNFREYHAEEWEALNEACDRIEKICDERDFVRFIPEMQARLTSLSFEDFEKRLKELHQSIAPERDHFVSRDVLRYGLH